MIYWFNGSDNSCYPYRPDMVGGGRPTHPDGTPLEGYELQPEGWTPPPSPEPVTPPDWRQFRLDSLIYFEEVLAEMPVPRAITLTQLVMRLPENAEEFAALWNATSLNWSGLGSAIASINEAAQVNDVPLSIAGDGTISVG